MTKLTRNWVVGLVVTGLLATVVHVAVGFAAAPDIAAKLWAQGLTASDRVAAARQFYALPTAFRPALLNVQTGQEKSDMIRSQITAYMAAKPNLTDEQRVLLQEAYNLATPVFCGARHATDDVQIGKRIMALLPREDAWLFVAPGGGVIGPQDEKALKYTASVLPLKTRVQLFLGEHLLASARNIYDGYCDCDIAEGTTICRMPRLSYWTCRGSMRGNRHSPTNVASLAAQCELCRAVDWRS